VKHFAIFKGYICTANADGSVPLNSKVACLVLQEDSALLNELIAQANLGKELSEAINAAKEPPEYVNALRKYSAAMDVKF
jgi:hypothetical protein